MRNISGPGRLFVLGVDGLSLPLARELSALHGLPALAGLAARPQARTVAAELPELSPVNWTSFFTGQGPETHGVYGFTRLDPASYAVSLTDFSCVRGPTIFDRLGEAGFSSTVLNLPNTYPARPIRGAGGSSGGSLVAGFVAPELSRAVTPPMLAPLLTRLGYRLEADTVRGKADPRFLADDLIATLAARERAVELLWPGRWDLFVCVLTETDRLFHFLLPACLEVEHPLHGLCGRVLRAVDSVIGRLIERFEALPGLRRLIALADHGFVPSLTEVDLNAWLSSRGFLRLTGKAAHELDAGTIAPGSRAFALDPGRVYVHARGRFARGSVAPHEAAAVARDVAEGLRSLTFDGREVMEQVLTRDECYPGASGPPTDDAPDLVCVAAPGFDLKAKFDRAEVFGQYGRAGCHSPHGALWYDSAGSRPARLRDAGRIILDHFGLAEAATAATPDCSIRP